MRGITSFGAYIPWYRMNRKMIYDQLGFFNSATAGVSKGEKAVANYDEDTISMAHAAAMACLGNISADTAEGLYLASLSLPFVQRQNALIVSDALGFDSNIRSADFTGALKAGTTALLSALDAVGAGSAGSIMVCAADCRTGKPGSAQEHLFGDGAAAMMVGSENVIAEYKGGCSVSHDFVDYRQITGERFLHAWEDRWVREQGFGKIIPEVINKLLKKYQLQISDFSKVIIPCPMTPWLKDMAKNLGVTEDKIQDNLQLNVGDTGTALPLMLLAAALEEARPGDKILLTGYGSGSDALYFEVTPVIEQMKHRKGIKDNLICKRQMDHYGKYLVLRNLLPLEVGIRGEIVRSTSMTVLWQQGRTVSALEGVKCKKCGTPQYPKHLVCVNPDCEAANEMEPYRFFNKTGRVVSFTGDNLAFCMDPPSIYGLVDFEEGGRLLLDFTDCTLDSVEVAMQVRMSFRRKYSDEDRGYYGYYWKAVPA